MHDFLSSTKKKNTIDRYLQKDKEKGTALITPQKEKMRVTFKIEPGKIKVEDSSKPSALETASVTKTVSPTTCGKVKEVYDPDTSPFEVGSIVSINGRDLDGFRFRNRMTAPTFYGVVNKMTVLDDIGFGDTKVSFVSSGQYEWVDKRNPNVMTGVWPHSKLTAYPYPPRDQHQDEPFNELDPGRWFKRGEGGWEVKELEDVCQACASPWCMWYKNNTLCKDIIQSVVDESDLYDTTKAARRVAYYRAVKSRYGSLGWNARVRTGWCYEQAVNKKFPNQCFW